MKNTQLMTSLNCVSKYAWKYIGKTGEQKHVVISVDGNNGTIMTRSAFLNKNMVSAFKKVYISKTNEYKASKTNNDIIQSK